MSEDIRLIIIEGDAGTGKGTVCKKLAEKLDMVHISTGSIYRYAAYILKNHHEVDEVKPEHEDVILNIIENLGAEAIPKIDDLDSEVYGQMARQVFELSVKIQPAARNYLNEFCEKSPKGVILDGRNGTFDYLPTPDFTFRLTANPEQCVLRKAMNTVKGEFTYSSLLASQELAEVEKSIAAREKGFAGREEVKPEVRVVDTSRRTAEEVFKKVYCDILFQPSLATGVSRY